MSTRAKLDWLRHRELLVLGAVGFAAALALGLVLLFREVQTNQYEMRTGNWMAVQLEIEFQRFLKTLARYSFNDPDTSYQDLTRRLDILWSRVLMTNKGEATVALRQDEMFVQAVADLQHALQQTEPFVQELGKGDIGAFHSIESTLKPLETELHTLVQHLIMESDTMAREEQLAIRYKETIGAFLGVIATGLATILMLVRERRRSDARARAEREARERVETESNAKSALLALLTRELKAQPEGQDATARPETMDGILDMARIQSGTLRIDSVDTELSRLALSCLAVVEPRAAAKGVVVLRRLDASLPALRSDERLLSHVLLSLMTGAVERVSDHDRIEVSTGLDTDGCPFAEVRDTGAPIAAADLAGIAPGAPVEIDILAARRSPRQDLLIARSFAEALGATLAVASTPGDGTTARLTLRGTAVLAAQPADALDAAVA